MASDHPFPQADPASPPTGPLESSSITVTPSVEFPRPRIKPGIPPIRSGGSGGRLHSLSPETAIPTCGLMARVADPRSVEDLLGELVDSLRPRPELPKSEVEKKLEMQIPPLLSEVRDGQIDSLATSLVVSALFVAVEATLLTGNGPPPPSKDGFRGSIKIHRLYLFLTYSAIALNLGATVGPSLLIQFLGSLSFTATDTEPPSSPPCSIRQLLAHYISPILFESDLVYRALEWRWLCAYYLGILCMFLQFLCYIWLYEVNLMAAVLTPIVLFALYPLVLVLVL